MLLCINNELLFRISLLISTSFCNPRIYNKVSRNAIRVMCSARRPDTILLRGRDEDEGFLLVIFTAADDNLIVR